MSGLGRQYWFAHWAGKPKSFWAVSWQGLTVFCMNIMAMIGFAQWAGRALWDREWLIAALCVALYAAWTAAIYGLVIGPKCDPARTVEDYQKDDRERLRARNERLQRRVDAARHSAGARRDITE